MTTRATVALFSLAGLALAIPAPALAAGNPAPKAQSVPTSTAGVLYLNLQTGERSLTLYKAASLPEPVEVQASALFDWWLSVDENPCWDDDRADGFGLFADTTEDVTEGITEPVVGFDFGDLPFDSQIGGVLLATATLAIEDTDSNADGTLDSGLDTVAVYYDGLSEGNRTSIAPPTAAVRIESIPGNRGTTPNGYDDYLVILDFGSDWFELGDSDGTNLGALWLPGAAPGYDYSSFISDCTTTTFSEVNCTIVPNPNADGLADFQYLQYYAQHGTDDKVTADSTFLRLGAPEGVVEFITYTYSVTCDSGSSSGDCTFTTVETIFIPDPLPQGQGTMESLGIATLGPGADTTNLDYSIGGCCYWYGGLDFAGFLDGLEETPPNNSTWYGYRPYSQFAMGLFTNLAIDPPCGRIDFNGDTLLDNGDISAFVQLFLQQDLSTDLNGDGIVDNGDIGLFVNIFLQCTG